jgi:5-methylcytosine-specific restriction enzyme subunit McrC
VKVPVRNVYLLLLYAWKHAGGDERTLVREEGFAHLHDLFAHVLTDTATRLLARGLDRQYRDVEEVIGGLRGKLDLAATLKGNHLDSARAHCRFDELRHDVLHNRILKATLRSLLELPLDPVLSKRCRELYRRMDAVSDVRITRRDFGQVQMHRNNRSYGFALRICQLVHENLMVQEGTGRSLFRDFRGDARQMGALFEDFVFNFFDAEQRRFRPSRPHILWHQAQGTEADLLRLPRMRTDVVLEAPDRTIILDTKFYAEALKGRFSVKKVDSGHLYQLFAYLENRSAALPERPQHEGMLLYPVVNDAFAFDYRLKGHRICVRSVDLDQPWDAIHRDMLKLLE